MDRREKLILALSGDTSPMGVANAIAFLWAMSLLAVIVVPALVIYVIQLV